MSSTKLTPSEVLQRQKARLRLQSDVLTETLENDWNYIQHNMGTIICNSVVEVVVSKGWLAQLILYQVKKWVFKQR